ncbi:antA/AntB antirepressor family protein [Escherichia coli]|uniref:antA/AntB antirepressor family protein n=2 Tax=Escherichia coli TaxID=562 RepID=UPI0005A8D27F|nr:antA/AntB antirepressor family protein [Escherichia coli]EFK9022075.1 phage antirepressor Ant [Escherichia coli]EHS3668341.1 antA/AntB antirepressor family protein [Escherichia coli]EHS4213397.1 antA/AntB antirepressor family protein [Escherichia coli]MCN9110722.1 antA/AntB antirepressor family protein [Escherichia coli]MCV1853171.1 antA/AntB antirepressor family protein [Escherichia coli]
MTSQLIPVFNGTISNETALLVNARDLHSFLDVGKRFASWIVERIAEYGFVENQDFMIISQVREKIGRGRPAKDYHLTLDTAKELAMVERNEKGRQIRRYFIECEKKLRSMQPAQQFTDEEIILLCYMQVQMENAQDICKRLYPIMKELNSSYASKLYDIAFETFYAVTKNRDVLLREATRLDQASAVFERARPMLKSLRARQFEF